MRIFPVWRERPSSVLEGARSWLGNELRGHAVPQRLRDAAGRLATLIDPKPAQPENAQVPVVSLEAALEARAAQTRTELPLDHAPHVRAEPAGVCPFTGMRADGTLAAAPSTVASAKDPTLDLTMPSADESTGSVEVTFEDEAPAVADKPARSTPKPRQKNKERLAGGEVVEKTSARSAARPAKKQPRSRTQATRKKA